MIIGSFVNISWVKGVTMAKIVRKLTDEQMKQLRSDFRNDIGMRLRSKREQRNMSLDELSEGMPVSEAALSKHENGKTEMPISYLPLYSLYCDFELRDLFPKDEMGTLLGAIKKSITIMSEYNERKRKKKDKGIIRDQSDKILQARIYVQDGVEVREEVKTRIETRKEMYRSADMPAEAEPFSDEEFAEYLKTFDSDIRDSLYSAGVFLERIIDEPRKDTLRKAVVDYIVDEVIINRVSDKYAGETAKRAYAYYKRWTEYMCH